MHFKISELGIASEQLFAPDLSDTVRFRDPLTADLERIRTSPLLVLLTQAGEREVSIAVLVGTGCSWPVCPATSVVWRSTLPKNPISRPNWPSGSGAMSLPFRAVTLMPSLLERRNRSSSVANERCGNGHATRIASFTSINIAASSYESASSALRTFSSAYSGTQSVGR